MIEWIIETLKANTHLVIFITLAIGYWMGGFKIGKFALGSVTGTLLAGVLIGQLGFDISPQVKTMFFTMFLFAVGYSVGPQFVQGVAKDGLPQAIFGVVVSLLCLASVYIGAKIAGYDVGLAAGLLAGSQTISASIGLATTAINNSGVENAEALLNQIPVAYAISYMWGTVGTGIILSVLGPKLLNVDLEKACKEYEAAMAKGTPAGGMNSAWQQLQMRAYRVKENGQAVGKTVAELEAMVKESRMFVERLRRDGTDHRLRCQYRAQGRRHRRDFRQDRGACRAERHGRGSGGLGIARYSGRIGRSGGHQQGSQWQDPDRNQQLGFRARRVPAQDHPGRDQYRHSDHGADQAQSRRHPQDFRPQDACTARREGTWLRRSRVRGDRHDLGRHLHLRVRPARRHHGQGRRCADHAVGLRRRVVRWPDPRLGAQRAARLSAAFRSRRSGS